MELSNIGVFIVIIGLMVIITLFVIPKIWQLDEWRVSQYEPVDIRIKLLEGGIIPTKAHDDDACYDLYLPKETFLRKGRQQIPLGFCLQLPSGYCAYIRSRSGNMSKGLENVMGTRFEAEVKTGIVDEGYRGTVGCIVECGVDAIAEYGEARHTTLAKGYRIGQMAILPVPKSRLIEVDSLDASERGEHGFGSTGTI
jgi:dUTP pyrophosphatase